MSTDGASAPSFSRMSSATETMDEESKSAAQVGEDRRIGAQPTAYCATKEMSEMLLIFGIGFVTYLASGIELPVGVRADAADPHFDEVSGGHGMNLLIRCKMGPPESKRCIREYFSDMVNLITTNHQRR